MLLSIIIIVALIGYLAYFIKLGLDLSVHKDNILRGLAGVDAVLIKKNSLILDILGYAKEYMDKESPLLKECFEIRNLMQKLPPRFDNSAHRYDLQNKFDEKFALLLGVVQKYKELKSNAGFQSDLQKLEKLNIELDEKIEIYNNAIDKMNWYINTFPSSIHANMQGIKPPPPRYERKK